MHLNTADAYLSSYFSIWLRGRGSNPRPSAYETDELPSALPHDILERNTGFEPALSAWKADVLAAGH